MKFLVLGDTHGNLRNFQQWIDYCVFYDIRLIFQVGDFGYFPNLSDYDQFVPDLNKYASARNIKIMFVHGNHDDLSDLYNGHGRYGNGKVIQIASNVYWTPTGVPFDIEDLHCMSVGGAYSIDQHMRTAGIDYFPEETLTWGDVEQCCIHPEKFDIIFSHDCPSEVDLDIDLIPGADSNRHQLQAIVEHCKPKWLFHGHYHHFHDTVMKIGKNKTRVIGLNRDGRNFQAATFSTLTNEIKIIKDFHILGQILRDAYDEGNK